MTGLILWNDAVGFASGGALDCVFPAWAGGLGVLWAFVVYRAGGWSYVLHASIYLATCGVVVLVYFSLT
jgi:hypothetical protein